MLGCLQKNLQEDGNTFGCPQGAWSAPRQQWLLGFFGRNSEEVAPHMAAQKLGEAPQHQWMLESLLGRNRLIKEDNRRIPGPYLFEEEGKKTKRSK
jgi:hypothetical protein